MMSTPPEVGQKRAGADERWPEARIAKYDRETGKFAAEVAPRVWLWCEDEEIERRWPVILMTLGASLFELRQFPPLPPEENPIADLHRLFLNSMGHQVAMAVLAPSEGQAAPAPPLVVHLERGSALACGLAFSEAIERCEVWAVERSEFYLRPVDERCIACQGADAQAVTRDHCATCRTLYQYDEHGTETHKCPAANTLRDQAARLEREARRTLSELWGERAVTISLKVIGAAVFVREMLDEIRAFRFKERP